MSMYRTPLARNMDILKAVQRKTSKYRLPFSKAETSEQLELVINKINHSILINSNLRLPQLSVSSEFEKNRRTKRPIGHPIYDQREVIAAEKSEQDEGNKQQEHQLAGSQRQEIEFKNLQINLHQNQSSRARQKLVSDTGDPPQSEVSSKIKRKVKFSLNKKRQYLSSNSMYDLESNADADNSQQSEIEPQINKNQMLSKGQKLPTIGERQHFKSDKDSDDSDENVGIWESLSAEIKQYQEQQCKKKDKSKRRIAKSESKRKTILQSECKQIESKLKQFHNKSVLIQKKGQYKSDIYANANEFKISDQKPKRYQKSKEDAPKQIQFIDLLKQSISFKPDKPKKSKLKLPLEFYLSSYQQIRDVNPFFRRVNQLGGCILLSIGKLTIIETGKSAYLEGDALRYLYIIVYGKFLLTNKYKTLRKISRTGETMAEEELFEAEKSYIQRLNEGTKQSVHREEARALNKSCLLRIATHKYYKMYRELSKMGYKGLFNLIDNLFRINYLNKQTSLHQNARDRLPTEVLASKKSPNPNFFL